MIYLRLTGGLGNQFFQIAAAVMLAKQVKKPIYVWTGAMKNYATPRTLSIDQIINLKFLGIQLQLQPNWFLKARVARLFPGIYGRTALVNDENILAIARSSQLVDYLLLDGYFIESIDQDFFDEATHLLAPALHVPCVMPHTNEICVIHVRGGDFLELGWSSDDIEHYYSFAIEKVRTRSPNIRLIVVSDDHRYAATLMNKLGECVQITEGVLASDFELIRSADFAILSNSTFSFWAGVWRLPSLVGWTTIAPDMWRPGHPRRIRLQTEGW